MLNTLQFVNLIFRGTIQQTIAIVNSARDKGMDQSFCVLFRQVHPYPPQIV